MTKSRDLNPDMFLRHGHFVGKTGDHIDAMLVKEILFDDAGLLATAVDGLADLVSERQPGLLVSQERHGAQLARMVGVQLNVPVLAYGKDGKVSSPHSLVDTLNKRSMIIEDNITTGRSVRELMSLVEKAGGSVGGIASVFSSSNNHIEFGVWCASLVRLAIVSKRPEDCTICESDDVKG